MKKTPPPAVKRVMIVDDHPLVRQGLIALLRTVPDLAVSTEAGGAEEALQILEKDVPDLMLLDISMPGINGLDLLKTIHHQYPCLYVLMLSMHEEDVYAERALRTGAHGYIMKNEPARKIIMAIRTVLNGGIHFSPAIASRVQNGFSSDKRQADIPNDLEKLTNRELQVYTYIGHGMATSKIAEQLNLSDKTIHVHRENIKHKLGFRKAPELVHHATHWVESETANSQRLKKPAHGS